VRKVNPISGVSDFEIASLAAQLCAARGIGQDPLSHVDEALDLLLWVKVKRKGVLAAIEEEINLRLLRIQHRLTLPWEARYGRCRYRSKGNFAPR